MADQVSSMLAGISRSFAQSTVSKLKPLYGRIIVERSHNTPKTAGGIVIPMQLQQAKNEGVVIAVGPGERDKDGKFTPINIKVGDRVALADWGGNEVKLDGKEYLIVREDDLLGVLE